ncbi:hypothetical protein CA265_11920 [Sphingobacteriaceae bacterium GW460-11-11-14-LB5]|nr:hypothetical protein CA265_11920 [Sphingobacteriaceae bacterium GW460-11-11-14-LB5]
MDPKKVYKAILSKHLKICSELISAKLGKPVMSSWVNADYIKLSALLLEETRVNISKNTLKRMFGKVKTEDSYTPQKASLDALASFVGYSDWEDFFLDHKSIAEDFESVTDQPVQISKDKKSWPLKLKKYLLGIAVVLSMYFVGSLFFARGMESRLKRVSLTCVNPDGEEVHSAVFKLKIPERLMDTASFTINFGDQTMDILSTDKKQIVHYYGIAGIYHAVLSYKGKPIDTTTVYVKTNHWIARFTQATTSKNSKIKDIKSEQNLLHIEESKIKDIGIDTIQPFYLTFQNIKRTGISGDNFELKARVFTSRIFPGVNCSEILFTVYGDSARHDLLILKPGCTAWAYACFSETRSDGSKYDLSSLGRDLRSGGDIRLLVRHKSVKFFLNGKQLFTTDYKKTIGNVCGLNFTFGGIGELRDISLRDLNTGETF